MESNTIFVEEEDLNKRIDKLLSDRFPNLSRTYFQYLIDRQMVLVNGEIIKKRMIPKVGSEIEIEFILTPEISLEAENIPLDILYEDEDLIAVNKKSGMVVHPGAGNYSQTFVNALLFHCKQIKSLTGLRPGIVHRLDKDTSGVLLAAKNERAQEKLVKAFATRQIKKEYLAICIGNPKKKTIETNIGRNPLKRKEMSILEDRGKPSITHVDPIAFDGKLSVVTLVPETGRTHQLRVHLQYNHTPILGDPIYGNLAINKKYQIGRTLLHAKKLMFIHPFTQKAMEIEAPIPDDIESYVQQLCRLK
jgi:23S rRNA pseudouridine1911/1915/1917 synthase